MNIFKSILVGVGVVTFFSIVEIIGVYVSYHPDLWFLTLLGLIWLIILFFGFICTMACYYDQKDKEKLNEVVNKTHRNRRPE